MKSGWKSHLDSAVVKGGISKLSGLYSVHAGGSVVEINALDSVAFSVFGWACVCIHENPTSIFSSPNSRINEL